MSENSMLTLSCSCCAGHAAHGRHRSPAEALLRFVRRTNRVALREGEAALRVTGRYSVLVALYQERGQFSAALDLLRTLSLVRCEPVQAHLPVHADAAIEQLAAHACRRAYHSAQAARSVMTKIALEAKHDVLRLP